MEEEFDIKDVIIPPIQYEYLDHTADIQLHAWGATLKEAFEQCGMAMFGYITELDTVDITHCYKIETEADDLEGLLYRFLNELLYLFSAEQYHTCKYLKIIRFENMQIECLCYGESFDLEKHPQGADVKAITYSAMSIIENDPVPEGNLNKKHEVFVILDI